MPGLEPGKVCSPAAGKDCLHPVGEGGTGKAVKGSTGDNAPAGPTSAMGGAPAPRRGDTSQTCSGYNAGY